MPMVKTADLLPPALDWAVATALNLSPTIGGVYRYINTDKEEEVGKLICINGQSPSQYEHYSPSTDWAQGGPILDHNKVDTLADKKAPDDWIASIARYQNGERLVGWRILQYGPTPLIAVMRALVASKLGDTVEIPQELLP